MKKLLFLTGFIASVIVVISYLFKALHWPGAGDLILLGFSVLIFVLLPLLFLYSFKKEFSRYISYKLKYIFGFLGTALTLSAIVLKLLHWQGPAILFLLAVAVIDFGFLPFLFYRVYNITTERKSPEAGQLRMKYLFGVLGTGFFLAASVFKYLRLPFSEHMLIISVAIIIFGFLPVLFYGMYRKSIA